MEEKNFFTRFGQATRMSILVDFRISTDRFELGDFIAAQEGTEAELERIVPTGDQAIPYVWVTGEPASLEQLRETLAASEKTTDVSVLDRLMIDDSDREQHLIRVEWILDELDIIRGILDAEGAILEGESLNHHWALQFRFQSHEQVATFYQFLTENEVRDFRIQSIYELDSRSDRNQANLTPEQREALVVAADAGYFDIPRETDLTTVGEDLGITQQAASERVRRGVRNVVFDELDMPTRQVS